MTKRAQDFRGLEDSILYVCALLGDGPRRIDQFIDYFGSPIQVAPQGVAPDRYVRSNNEGINFLWIGMQKSGSRRREDTDRLIEPGGTVNQMMSDGVMALFGPRGSRILCGASLHRFHRDLFKDQVGSFGGEQHPGDRATFVRFAP